MISLFKTKSSWVFPSLVSGSTLHQLPSNWLVIIDFSPLFLTYLIHPQVLSIFKHLKSNPIRHHCSSLSHHPLSWGPLWWTSTFHSPAVIDFSPSSQSDLFQTLSMMRYFSGFTFFNGSLCKSVLGALLHQFLLKIISIFQSKFILQLLLTLLN